MRQQKPHRAMLCRSAQTLHASPLMRRRRRRRERRQLLPPPHLRLPRLQRGLVAAVAVAVAYSLSIVASPRVLHLQAYLWGSSPLRALACLLTVARCSRRRQRWGRVETTLARPGSSCRPAARVWLPWPLDPVVLTSAPPLHSPKSYHSDSRCRARHRVPRPTSCVPFPSSMQAGAFLWRSSKRCFALSP